MDWNWLILFSAIQFLVKVWFLYEILPFLKRHSLNKAGSSKKLFFLLLSGSRMKYADLKAILRKNKFSFQFQIHRRKASLFDSVSLSEITLYCWRTKYVPSADWSRRVQYWQHSTLCFILCSLVKATKKNILLIEKY